MGWLGIVPKVPMYDISTEDIVGTEESQSELTNCTVEVRSGSRMLD